MIRPTCLLSHFASTILLALVLVYMVMAAQFESLRDPFIILFSIPLAVIGVVMMLLLTASLPAENCLVARFCPAAWHATAYGAKFVLGLGVSSLALPMMGAIYDGTGGFYWLYVALGAAAALGAAVKAMDSHVGRHDTNDLFK